ncbi:ABC transporter ATP-binding protein [Oceanivirga salmonicida]|uniref:ABC transporter ATP-binding protein n=1 Tax=Oceanivirga salmonicida TaxID=1769291 RepID=UPI0012E28DEA|nr:ATP-binding cassette domain-containing protein [Oceanivirga salmonicida]
MLSIKNLNKSFGSNLILNNVNLELSNGKILGLLGPNGSGKTSLMKILVNIGAYDSGEIEIMGEKLCKETNRYISYLPDVIFLDENMSIGQAISNHKLFYKDFNEEKSEKLLKELKLDKKQKIKRLSKGMKEKLNLILVLSRDAKLFILDEPIAGVDIVTRQQILKLIIENINEDASVIVTTHLIKDIEQIFDEVCFLNEGNISKIYNVEEVRVNNEKSVEELYLEFFGGVINA